MPPVTELAAASAADFDAAKYRGQDAERHFRSRRRSLRHLASLASLSIAVLVACVVPNAFAETPEKGGAKEVVAAAPTSTAKPDHGGNSVEIIKEVGSLLDGIKWAFIVGFVVVWYRKELAALIASLERRGVTLGVEKVTLTLADVSTEGPLPALQSFATTPFDEPGLASMVAAGAILEDVKPQIGCRVSDWVAIQFAKTDPGAALSVALRAQRQALEDACRDGSVARAHLVEFAKALEASRFLGADFLCQLARKYIGTLQTLLDRCQQLTVADEDCLILLCYGTALAMEEEWTEAKRVLALLVDTQPAYLPAVPQYIGAFYNAEIVEKPTADQWVDVTALESILTAMAQRFEPLLVPGFTIPPLVSPANAPFYVREFNTAVGTIWSLLAELPDARRDELLSQAQCYLERCTQPIAWQDTRVNPPTQHLDLPTIRDFNSLADLQKQQRKYEQGLRTLADGPPGNPAAIVSLTRAQIFDGMDKPLEAMLELQALRASNAQDASDDEVLDLIDAQIYYARLVARGPANDRQGNARRAITILDAARALLESRRSTLSKSAFERPHGELVELTAYAYLRLDDGAEEANKLFARCETTEGARQWRQKVALAGAYLVQACLQRRELSPVHAGRGLGRAKSLLQTAPEKLESLAIAHASPWVGAQRFRMHLDALQAVVRVGEECLQQSDIPEAKRWADSIARPLQAGLQEVLLSGRLSAALQKDRNDIEKSLQKVEGHRCFILGRAMVEEEPSSNPGILYLQKAKVLNDKLAGPADLAAGVALLKTAFSGTGQLVPAYDRGVAALEEAVRRGESGVRSDALRILASVYSQRGHVERRQKQLGGKS